MKFSGTVFLLHSENEFFMSLTIILLDVIFIVRQL